MSYELTRGGDGGGGLGSNRVKGRQHQYYTSKPTEQAFIKFDLEAGTSSPLT